ncbi:hypothetical protein SDC9_53024 [bioreactor metagenome]|uniref:Uncharacterized protein n=1 Tax=bioreactor metagenome TaxID=1076179 RepID=A0A644WT61_9ZZZZ
MNHDTFILSDIRAYIGLVRNYKIITKSNNSNYLH